MSLHRFFLDDQVLSAEEGGSFALRLSDADAHHARVLRLAPGEHIAVVDAAGDCFECEVVRAGDDVVVSIASREGGVEPAFRLTLFQALVKGDKMETVVRHATEVGAGAFVPFSSSRCVSRPDGAKAARKRDRWAAIARSAAMQSGRCAVPEVAPVATFQGALERLGAFDAVVVFWEEAAFASTLHDALAHVEGVVGANVAVVVGPEGGLSEDEVASLLAANGAARVASLGPTILRAETAAVVGLALASYELGGMGVGPLWPAEGDA